jgi:D-alanyl-D-alanine dipeptidase
MSGNNLAYPTEIDAYELKYAKQVLQYQFDEFEKHLIKDRHDFMDTDETAIKNRQFLKELMESHGFESIEHEWWHYNLLGSDDWEKYPMIEW